MHLITALMKRPENKFWLTDSRWNLINALQNLYKKIAYQESDILVKVIKRNNDLFSYFIHHGFNNALVTSVFPSQLKKVDIKPVHKKEEQIDTENYCSGSILPVLSKIYERCMFDQIYI